jgi:hypothetical protein
MNHMHRCNKSAKNHDPCNSGDKTPVVKLGLTLEGDQIQRFEDYIQNPTCTDLGIEIIRKAVLDARAGKFQRR